MPGLAWYIINTVRKCVQDIRQLLLSNIVLTGGASLLPGLASRLQLEVEKELRKETDDFRGYSVHPLRAISWRGKGQQHSPLAPPF